MNEGKDTRAVEALPGYEPEIGRLLWMLEQGRQRTKACVAGLPEDAIDWTPSPETNSIGALLYHIAAIELDWLYVEVLEDRPFPQAMIELFTEDVRDERGQLATARSRSLAEHLNTLDGVRDLLLETFREISLADYRRLRVCPEYDVTPEWVLYHLMQHEAGHRGEISLTRSQRAIGS